MKKYVFDNYHTLLLKFFLLTFLFSSFNSVYSKRGPLSEFERIATETSQVLEVDEIKDPMRPRRRIPKKSDAIPELKAASAADKKKWDDLAAQTRSVLIELFRLERARVEHHDSFSPEQEKEEGRLWDEYKDLMKQAEELFDKIVKKTS